MLYHKHHIKPRHMGGTDHPSNLLKCNITMHAFLHKLLWEKHGHWQDEIAWKALSGQITYQEANHLKFKQGGYWHKGKKRSENFKKKISEVRKGKIHSTESKNKMSQTRKQFPKVFSETERNNYREGTLHRYGLKWNIISPDGVEYFDVSNLTEFCKTHNLLQGNMNSVASGRHSHHKGWKCSRIKQIKENLKHEL